MSRLTQAQWTRVVSAAARDKTEMDQLMSAANEGGGTVAGISIGKEDVPHVKTLLPELNRFVGGRKLQLVDADAWAMGILHHTTIPPRPDEE